VNGRHWVSFSVMYWQANLICTGSVLEVGIFLASSSQSIPLEDDFGPPLDFMPGSGLMRAAKLDGLDAGIFDPPILEPITDPAGLPPLAVPGRFF